MRSPKLNGKREDVKKLCSFAMATGWAISFTRGLNYRFSKAGCAPVFFSGTPGDHRAWLNARAQMRRADAQKQINGNQRAA